MATLKFTSAFHRKTQKAAEQQAKNPAVDQKKILGDYRLHYARVMKLPTDSLDMAITKLEHLQMLLRANRDKGFMSPSQIAASEKEVQRLEQMVAKLDQTAKETTTSLRQATQTPAQNATQAAQATKQYSDEIKRLAQELRQAESIFKSQYGLSVSTTNDSGLRDYSIWMENRKSEYGETMSYEEQLLRLMKEKNMTYEQLVQRIREALVATEQMVNTERRRDAERRSSNTNAPTRFQDFENLRAAIAHVMKTEQSNILLVDQENASYNNLSKSLKQLQDAYHKLSASERNSDMGKNLANEIQITQRAVQQFQAQMSRPVSFNDALRGGERTIEEITYKIQRLQLYRSGIDITNPQQAGEMKLVDAELNRLNKDLDKYRYVAENAQKTNNTLTRSWNYMKNRLAFYLTVGTSTQFVKTLIDVRSQYEMTERALGILVDSAERGTQIFNELSHMALMSPYTLIELSAAAKQLTAYDVASKDVVDTTRRLADMAAAVGIPIERLTYALGQIKAYGYLNARDARMFANAGIPLIKELSNYYTHLEGQMVSVADVYDRIKKKAIDYNDVMSVVNGMTDEGGKFFDFQAKMAGTLKVQLANLTLAWNNMLNDIGQSNQSLITIPISGLKELFLAWKSIDRVLTSLIITLGSAKAIQILFNLSLGKGTLNAIKEAAAIETSTTATYENIISKSKLNAAQAKFLIATNRSNTALRQAIINTGLLSVEEAKLAATTTGFRRMWLVTWTGAATVLKGAVVGIKAIGAAMLTMLTNPAFLAMSAITAITDLTLQWQQNQEAILELNNEIRENAKNASDSISKFRTENQAYADTIKGMQKDEAAKVWLSIKEELENSALSAKFFMSELNSIGDIADRVSTAFDIARRIEEAQLALTKIDETALKVNNDIAWGALGEGLAEDLEDYKERIEEFKEIDKEFKRDFSLMNWGSNIKGEMDEATSEIEKFAANATYVIERALGPEAMSDSIKVTEAIERIKQEMKLKHPEISGAAEVLFDLKLDKIFAKQFNGVYKESTSLWDMLMQEIKSKHSSAFQDISDEIYEDQHDWTNEQKVAIAESIEYMRDNIPTEFHSILDEMVRDLNSRDFTIHIGYTFGIKELDALQKDFQRTFISGSGVLTEDAKRKLNQKYGRYNKKDDENTLEWQKRLSDEYNKQNELLTQKDQIIKTTTGDVKASAVNEKEELKESLDVLEEIRKHEGFDFSKKGKKTTKGGKKSGKQEDLLSKALKDELSIIKEMRSNYDKLRKSGVDAITALQIASSGYEGTINRINSILGKHGISPFNAKDFVGKDATDPNTLLAMLVKQRDALLKDKSVKTSSLKDLDIEIQKLNVDAKTYNMKKVSDGLNNELSKIKEEYELMVSIDAMPELGDIFTNLFNIDTSKMPKNIEEVVARYQDAINNGLVGALYGGADMDVDDLLAPFDLLTTDLADWATKTGVETGSTLYNSLQQAQKQIRDMVEKDKNETIKQIKELQYKLADTNGKIAIEEEKLEILRQKYAQETNEERRKLLELQIQDQQNAIAKLKETILSELPTYKALFDGIVEHSSRMTRRLAQNYKKMLDDARKKGKNSAGKYVITDPINGEETEVTEEKLNKEIEKANNKLRETQSSFAKIQEALTKGDWVKAIELIAGEAHKVADGVGEIANIAESLGASEETVDTFNAIADSIDGIATASEGVAQIANFDVIGGSVNVIKGLWQSISSWFDRSNKRITRQVKESERAVKQLENAYKNLEYAVEHSMGAAETQARRAAIANKRLQITELENQLTLEKSRKKKNQDEDKIRELEGALIDARHELQDLSNDIMNTLLGSDIKSAAEEFVDTWVQAWRAGETTLDAIKEKMDEMVFNLIKKAATSKIVGNLLQPLYNAVDMFTTDSSEGGVAMTTNELKALASLAGQLGVDINEALGAFYGNLENLDIISKSMDNKELSALQQGIQGITEDTASALEAYMNGVSQQVYLHSDLLTQIRDAVVAMDGDIQMSVQAQMLLQLQQSYQIQSAIQSIMVGWSNPSGNAVKVELLN